MSTSLAEITPFAAEPMRTLTLADSLVDVPPSTTQGEAETGEFEYKEPVEPKAVLLDRHLGARATVELIVALNADIDQDQLAAARSALLRSEDALKDLPESEGSPELEQLVSAERAITAAERATLELDQQLGTDEFCARFEGAQAAPELIARYARLLARSRLSGRESRDRYEFLATRLLRTVADDGRFILLSREQAAPRLRYVAPAHMVAHDPKGRANAVEFFESFARRAVEMKEIEALLNCCYKDLYGFKLAIRVRIIDPDVLYAVVKVNVLLTNLLRRVPRARSAEARRRITDSQIEVRQVLFNQPATSRGATTTRGRIPARVSRRATGVSKVGCGCAPSSGFRLTPRCRKRATLAAALLASGLLLGFVSAHDRARGPRAVPAVELSQISPLLEGGFLVRGDSVFIGELRTARWMRLTPPAQEAAARKMWGALRARGVLEAVVSAGDEPAFQLTRSGEVEMW